MFSLIAIDFSKVDVLNVIDNEDFIENIESFKKIKVFKS